MYVRGLAGGIFTVGKYRCDLGSGLPVEGSVPWYEYSIAFPACMLGWNDPSIWMATAKQAAAEVYESAQYGKIPRPGEQVPGLPGPGPGPQTETELRTWTLEQQAASDLDAWGRAQGESRAAIQAAIDRGDYHPGGRLPVDADLNPTDSMMWWILGGVLGTALVAGLVVRR